MIFTVAFYFFTIFYISGIELVLPVSRTAQNVTSRRVFMHLRKKELYEYYQEEVHNLLYKVENWVLICLFYATLYLYRFVHISTALLSKCIMCRNREKMDYFNVSVFFIKCIDTLIVHKTVFLRGKCFKLFFAVFCLYPLSCSFEYNNILSCTYFVEYENIIYNLLPISFSPYLYLEGIHCCSKILLR